MFIAIKFNPDDKYTDFEFMIQNEKNTLFIYNENVELWKSMSLKKGKGNAVVRPYRADLIENNNNNNNNFSLGIPTAYFKTKYRAIKDLNYIEPTEGDKLLELIDIAINNIDSFINKNRNIIKKIYWSADENNLIGLALFKNKFYNQLSVLLYQEYITNKLKLIANKYNYELK